jgi:hypothetical protein
MATVMVIVSALKVEWPSTIFILFFEMEDNLTTSILLNNERVADHQWRENDDTLPFACVCPLAT